MKVLYFKKRYIYFLCFSLVLIFIFKIVIYNIFPFKYKDIIIEEANNNNLSPNLVAAVIKAESSFAEDAVSKAGAKGLMQLTDETAKYCSEKMGDLDYEIFLPEDNIKMGTWYFNLMLSKFDGNLYLACAAYNAGEGNVRKWLKDERYIDENGYLVHIPFPETKTYVKRVKLYKKIYDILY